MPSPIPARPSNLCIQHGPWGESCGDDCVQMTNYYYFGQTGEQED